LVADKYSGNLIKKFLYVGHMTKHIIYRSRGHMSKHIIFSIVDKKYDSFMEVSQSRKH